MELEFFDKLRAAKQQGLLEYYMYLLQRELDDTKNKVADRLIEESVRIFNSFNSDDNSERDFWEYDTAMNTIAAELAKLKAVDQLEYLYNNTGYGQEELEELGE